MNLDHEADMPWHESRDSAAWGWLGWWAAYMLAVLVGAVLGGRSTVEITSASFGMPLAWLTGWLHRRRVTWGYGVAAILVTAGAAVGLFGT
jgi:hypothetical protein